MHRMTVNSSEHLCGGLNAKSAPDKWLRAPTGSGSVGPKYAERSKNTKKLRRVGYWCLERTHAHHLLPTEILTVLSQAVGPDQHNAEYARKWNGGVRSKQ